MDKELQNNHLSQGPCRNGRSRRRRRAVPADLQQALEATPESRANVVARASQLVRDPGYPTDEVLGLIAQLLATRIEKNSMSF